MANPLSKKALKDKYDEYRRAVRDGKMSKEEFAKQGKIMAASYQANKGRNKPAPKAKANPAPKAKPATAKTASSDSNGRSRFFQGSSGTRGQNLPSNPQLKSKPKRSDFPAGRSGQAKYAAALRTYNKKPAKPRRKALTMAERRRARRSSR